MTGAYVRLRLENGLIIWLRCKTQIQLKREVYMSQNFGKNWWLMEVLPPEHVLLVLLQPRYLATQGPVPKADFPCPWRGPQCTSNRSTSLSGIPFMKKNSSTGLHWRNKTWLRLWGTIVNHVLTSNPSLWRHELAHNQNNLIQHQT